VDRAKIRCETRANGDGEITGIGGSGNQNISINETSLILWPHQPEITKAGARNGG